jgi:DNA polymerase I
MKKQIILIDGTAYLYRAFYALPPLTNSTGLPTHATFGVVSMLRKLIKTYQPEYIAVVFDSKEKTFRSEIYREYKANRLIMPDALQQQIEPLYAVIRAMGLPLLVIEGVEADDVIGTITQAATQQSYSVLISTSDKDLAQLVNDDVTLINTMSNTVLDRTGVFNKFGVWPEQIPDYLCLIGDSVDNIPGIPDVGPKTAARWLQQYQTLERLCQHADQITGKSGQRLRDHLENLVLSKKLVLIKTDVPLNISLTDLRLHAAQPDALRKLYRLLEFKQWLDELPSPEETPDQATEEEIVIETEVQLNQRINQFKQAASFALHTQGSSEDPMAAELLGISFAVDTQQSFYIPLLEKQFKSWVLTQLKPILENTQKQKIGHDLKYDRLLLAQNGIDLASPFFDTELEAYILNNTTNPDRGIRHYVLRKSQQRSAKIGIQILKLHQTLLPQLEKDPVAMDLLVQLEMPLLSILVKMEQRGVLIDVSLLQKLSQSFNERLTILEKKAYQQVGKKFNLNSPKQLQLILFSEQGLPILEKTPTGQPSTAEPALQRLSNFPLPAIILEHRVLSKLKTTYTDKLPQQINPKTGRIHTCYHQALVTTGRLSSSNPNLQNIPIRDLGFKIREAFIAAEGYQLISADYSQIELRIMAHLSQDQGLLTAFAQNLDIHQTTAAEVLGIPMDQVTSEQRRSAKAINFGLIYGMSAFGLSKQLKVERSVAEAYIQTYFTRYPQVKHYIDSARQLAKEQGFVTTLLGRRLYIPDIHSRNRLEQKAGERAAINAPLQGTAAEIIKRAMISVDQALKKQNLDAHLIMQVHDELVFEVLTSDLDASRSTIVDCMVHAVELTIPLQVSLSVGPHWAMTRES